MAKALSSILCDNHRAACSNACLDFCHLFIRDVDMRAISGEIEHPSVELARSDTLFDGSSHALFAELALGLSNGTLLFGLNCWLRPLSQLFDLLDAAGRDGLIRGAADELLTADRHHVEAARELGSDEVEALAGLDEKVATLESSGRAADLDLAAGGLFGFKRNGLGQQALRTRSHFRDRGFDNRGLVGIARKALGRGENLAAASESFSHMLQSFRDSEVEGSICFLVVR